MAIGFKISEFNQQIAVTSKSKARQADGTYAVTTVPKFTTPFAKITPINSAQFFTEGMSEKDSYYWVSVIYDSGRYINMGDAITWNGKTLKPVGDCQVEAIGDKRVIKQKVKHTSDV